MQPASWRKIIDSLLFLSGAALFGSGLGLAFHINRGIGDFHLIAGIFFVCLLIFHVSLNRQWIVNCLAGGRRGLALAGLICVAFVIFLSMFFPAGPDEHRQRERRQDRAGQP